MPGVPSPRGLRRCGAETSPWLGFIFSIAACCLLNSYQLCKGEKGIVGALKPHSCISHISFSGRKTGRARDTQYVVVRVSKATTPEMNNQLVCWNDQLDQIAMVTRVQESRNGLGPALFPASSKSMALFRLSRLFELRGGRMIGAPLSQDLFGQSDPSTGLFWGWLRGVGAEFVAYCS